MAEGAGVRAWVDTSTRSYEDRMAQARRWTRARLAALHKRPPDYAELMAVVAAVVARKGDGWTVAPEPTRADILREYRRVIRRNLWTSRGRVP